MRMAAAVLLLFAGAAGADEAPVENWPGNAVGIWAAEPEWCAFAAQIGTHDPAPVALSETEFLGLENSCTITRATPTGVAQSWALDLQCQSEGDYYDGQMLVFMAGADTLYIYDGFAPTRFERCAIRGTK